MKEALLIDILITLFVLSTCTLIWLLFCFKRTIDEKAALVAEYRKHLQKHNKVLSDYNFLLKDVAQSKEYFKYLHHRDKVQSN